MPKVRTDKQLINTFLTRGVAEIYPSRDELDKRLMSGQRMRVYQGFDPTGPFLHVGHAIGIRAMRILQELGHEVIFLIGDYTAKIGDPDKAVSRKILSDEELEKNMAGWKEQAGRLIDFEGENPVLFKKNSEWLSKLTYADLIKLMSKATVQQMLERDLFAKRLKENNPIQLQELIYPLMQGFDGVAMEVDMEMGGTDQIFNMLVGRNLTKQILGKEKFVRANELMEAPDAVTMSKTKGNGINLSDTAENMYGKAMSYSDELITKALRLLTEVPMEDIWDMEKQMAKGENPMNFKKIMAFEVVKLIKGEKEAKRAEEHFERTVQKKEIVKDEVVEIPLGNAETMLDILKSALGGKSSASEIKRTIEQGGVEINQEKIVNPNQKITFKKGEIIKYGKRKYFKIK